MHDIIYKKRKDQSDQPFEKLNKNHVNVNYTVEVCPEKVLDTKVIYPKNSITTKVDREKKKSQKLNSFLNADDSLRFTKSAIKQLSQKSSKIGDLIIPSLFEIPTPTLCNL